MGAAIMQFKLALSEYTSRGLEWQVRVKARTLRAHTHKRPTFLFGSDIRVRRAYSARSN